MLFCAHSMKQESFPEFSLFISCLPLPLAAPGLPIQTLSHDERFLSGPGRFCICREGSRPSSGGGGGLVGRWVPGWGWRGAPHMNMSALLKLDSAANQRPGICL
ncbi:hypothetical protein ATANTOWER_023708 [Ataeniobius toweri]|uniref:Uncharacterized protein n=1 Tax=Ataeniobius toweri TaxID=208326 RepID=A0ABU7AI79_9TELE|nr:hypothetical protein [Ataeniobius toweri]